MDFEQSFRKSIVLVHYSVNTICDMQLQFLKMHLSENNLMTWEHCPLLEVEKPNAP